tara:strand:+ start:291 stop:578 length:288 start_codon:yes stop_codon:yes gene_type:complete
LNTEINYRRTSLRIIKIPPQKPWPASLRDRRKEVYGRTRHVRPRVPDSRTPVGLRLPGLCENIRAERQILLKAIFTLRIFKAVWLAVRVTPLYFV